MECFVIFVMAWCWCNATESKPQNVSNNLKNDVMKKVIIIILLIIYSSSYSQTKEETEKWIIEKYNQYESPVNKFRELIFQNGYIYYLWSWNLRENEFGGGYWTQLPIKEIKQIEIIHEKFDVNDHEGWDKIILHFEKNKSKTKDGKNTENNNYEISEQTTIEIKLSSNFIKDGLKTRMENALLYLIKSYGGKATLKKEPF